MSAVVRDIRLSIRSLRRIFGGPPKRLVLKGEASMIYTTYVWKVKGIVAECLVGDEEKPTKLENLMRFVPIVP